MVRYADDFKIFCATRKDADRAYHATKAWLQERLKLEISEEKSKIVNLKKGYSEFLGFKLTLMKKRGVLCCQVAYMRQSKTPRNGQTKRSNQKDSTSQK